MGIAYRSKKGLDLFKPTLEEARQGETDNMGWCLACGELTTPAEPDAARYICECCEKPMVFGTQELALMGLVV